MNATGSVALALVLVVLTLCSTGQALQCYQCNTFVSENCRSTQTCSGSEDTCMKVTSTDTGLSKYGCRSMASCSTPVVQKEFTLTNIKLQCCQNNLCNRSPVTIPITALVLSLATALLMLFSL